MIKNCMKRNVISIQATATIQEAAVKMSDYHVGLLPVVDQNKNIIGMIGLPDLLSLEMPAFFNLMSDIDFVGDFGAAETRHPSAEQIGRQVTTLMQPVISVTEESGLLHAYGLLLKHNLSDLPVISGNGKLVGVVSRVDISAAILSSWKDIKGMHP